MNRAAKEDPLQRKNRFGFRGHRGESEGKGGFFGLAVEETGYAEKGTNFSQTQPDTELGKKEIGLRKSRSVQD